jgi:hypothetical protein
MTDVSLSSKRNIFTATHSVFLHQIDGGSLASTRRGFFPAYRMGIGKNSDMVGKIPTGWEKFRHGGKNSSLEMGHGRKNSHIVGKIPTWLEKKTGRGIHEGNINLSSPYMSWSLILSNYNSILSFSVTCHTW